MSHTVHNIGISNLKSSLVLLDTELSRRPEDHTEDHTTWRNNYQTAFYSHASNRDVDAHRIDTIRFHDILYALPKASSMSKDWLNGFDKLSRIATLKLSIGGTFAHRVLYRRDIIEQVENYSGKFLEKLPTICVQVHSMQMFLSKSIPSKPGFLCMSELRALPAWDNKKETPKGADYRQHTPLYVARSRHYFHKCPCTIFTQTRSLKVMRIIVMPALCKVDFRIGTTDKITRNQNERCRM